MPVAKSRARYTMLQLMEFISKNIMGPLTFLSNPLLGEGRCMVYVVWSIVNVRCMVVYVSYLLLHTPTIYIHIDTHIYKHIRTHTIGEEIKTHYRTLVTDGLAYLDDKFNDYRKYANGGEYMGMSMGMCVL
ncbi:hypothetical protein EON63_12010 [archaeon]|nr:MAG: hypothetical protein EON63_12010 [archaeon]